MIRQPNNNIKFFEPSSGVGGLLDLQTSIAQGPVGKWTFDINPGWAYVQGVELWNSVGSKSLQVTGVTGSSIILTTDVAWSYGPVTVFDNQSNYYVPINGHTKVASTITWSQSGSTNIWTGNLPSGLLIGACWQMPGNVPYLKHLGEAPNLEYLSSSTYFVSGTTIHVISNSNPSTGLLLQIFSLSPSLRYEEILKVKNGKLYPQYSERSQITLTCLSSSSTVTGLQVGPINAPFSLPNGAYVVAKYNVPYSYSWSTSGILVYGHPSSSLSITASYPTTPFSFRNYCESFPGSTINLNPILDNCIRSGYLGANQSVVAALKRIEVTCNKKDYCLDWGEQIQVRIRAIATNDLVRPDTALTVSVLGADVVGSYPTSAITSQRGERLILITPTASSVSITCNSGSISGSCTITSRASSSILSSSLFTASTPVLVESIKTNNQGLRQISASLCRLDGVPLFGTLTLLSTKKTRFTTSPIGATSSTQSLAITTSLTEGNIWGVQNNAYGEISHRQNVYAIAGEISREIKFESN